MDPVKSAQVTPARLKGDLIAEVARVAAGRDFGQVDSSRERVTEFVEHYLEHVHVSDLVGMSSLDLLRLLEAHFWLAVKRQRGEDLVVLHPPTDAWDFGNSGVLQIVTDDRPFLVDSVSNEITRQGWTIRDLFHPQFVVARDPAGNLIDIVHRDEPRPDAIAESWMTLVLYPLLGDSVESLREQLLAGVCDVLHEVRTVTDDWPQMRRALIETMHVLRGPEYASRPSERDQAVDLLDWLLADNFTLLGFGEFALREGAYVPVAGTGLGVLRGDAQAPDSFQALPTSTSQEICVFTKDTARARVHRTVLRDYIGVRLLDQAGQVTGERRFLGVMASPAYTEPVTRIPLLSSKARQIVERSGYQPASHGAKALLAALNAYPRDELFHSSTDDLYPIIERISAIGERRQVKVFCRFDPWRRFLTCLVYLPRDRYTTVVRNRIQDLLMEKFHGTHLEFQALVSESVLARLYFVVTLPPDAVEEPIDIDQLEREFTEATRSWEDRLIDQVYGWPSEQRGVDYPEAYKEEFTPEQGVEDLKVLNLLMPGNDTEIRLVDPLPGDAADLRLKVFRRFRTALPDVLPHLDRLGVRVIDEWPYEITLRGEQVWLYEFGLTLPDLKPEDWAAADRARFVDAFEASQTGRLEVGPLNALVTRGGLQWFEVTWVRAMERYLKQGGMPYSIEYIAGALLANPHLTRRLVEAFRVAHDPARGGTAQAKRAAAEQILTDIEKGLENVASLDHDRILRGFVSLQRAIVRTNAFVDGVALAFKLLPRELALLPEPRPMFEIWVHSPQVEGVHLRFGKVARGGLRWSDRAEDFRTEVLGLVKAQMVKNTVIVPVGAKGGFVPRHLPDPSLDRFAWLEAGKAAYRTFIVALLSLTDSIDRGAIVPAAGVVRHDDDDPYLVVAADKGTATFSDIANQLSLERGFWLGDAFASGGGKGYDHKAMGITARGAWESVKRHFYEMDIDCQAEDFTVVGIGDMSGDVFGNGMLLSRHIRLVAAFDHRHVFVDPTPDAETSFVERERMFALPRSSWADYDTSVISAGGGVYRRDAKSIPITDEARAALGIPDGVTKLSPVDYIHAILQAPVDLLWNGGIGTYVKATTESHADVGDRANDATRVDATEVRARCAGEGGNLGWTQRGRIQYARAGGRINTDFIDNSAGVDTSDHEVNIKILLADLVHDGRLTPDERDALLPEMTDDVAGLVLAHNVDQNLTLAGARYHAARFAAIHEDWMRVLEEAGYLDRAIESMPTSAEMKRRIKEGEGLTSPELATLLAWTKIRLADIVLDSDLPDDPYLADRLVQYFPRLLRESYRDAMPHHRLHRDIITTVAVNRFVNSQGITAYHRLSSDTGASAAEVIRAQLAARAIFRAGPLEVAAARLRIDAEAGTRVRISLRHLVDRGTRWVLQTQQRPLDIQAVVDRYTEPVKLIVENLSAVLTPAGKSVYDGRLGELQAEGVPDELARTLAGSMFAPAAPPIVEIAQEHSREVLETAEVFFAVRERVGLGRLLELADELPRTDRWSLMAQSAVSDELLDVQTRLAAAAIGESPNETDPDAVVATFEKSRPDLAHVLPLLGELRLGAADLGRLSVAVRLLRSVLRRS